MRILMLAQWYPPILGGEELHVQNLSRSLAARGHDVTVATLRQDGLAAEDQDGPVRVVRLEGGLQRIPGLFSDTARRSAAPIADPLLATAIDRLAREMRADVLHAHNWMVHAALPVRAARHVALVQTMHDFSLNCAQKLLLRHGRNCSGPGPLKCLECTADHYGTIKGPITTLANWSDGLAQRRLVDAFIAVSRAVADLNDLPAGRHEVIPNFIPDGEAVAPPDAATWHAMLPAEPYVAFVGAANRAKGVGVLLDAWRGAPDLPPLVLIGYRTRETEELLADLPPRVHALGQWPPAAITLAWRGALAAIVPSINREACPTVILEAMRDGRPVIATALGGNLDLVDDGATGILIPPADPEAVRSAVRLLADDAALARGFGDAGRDRAGAYMASAVVPRIEALYERVVARQRGRERVA